MQDSLANKDESRGRVLRPQCSRRPAASLPSERPLLSRQRRKSPRQILSKSRTSPDFRRESCFMGASNSCQLARLFAWDWQPIQSQRVRSAMIRCSCLEAGIAGAMTDLNTVWTRFGPASSPLSGEADMDRQVKPAGTVANDRAAKLAAIPAGESPANRDAMGRRRGYCIHRR